MRPAIRTEIAPDPAGLGSLLVLGTASQEAESFRARVRGLIAAEVAPLVPAAERDRCFPREAVRAFGAAGLFGERWSGGPRGDLGRCVVMAEEMGRSGLGGVGVGVSLHLDAAVALLVRHARTPYAESVLDHALAGRYVCCVATSEQHVGSDLSAVRTELRRAGDGWRVTGTKWFVSPGAAADVALVLCSAEGRPAIALVPREGLTVVKRLETTGMRGLATVRLAVDALVPDEAVLVRPGLGLAALMAALASERLAIAAQVAGALDLALTLAATHLRRRRQFGAPLYEHQALRLRIADLAAQAAIARRALYATVAELTAGGQADLCDLAGLKVTVARLGERVASECMHIFGGRGYVEDETPLARLWRDVRVGRVGGGTDEMMWELVASGLRADEDLYDHWIER